MVEQRQTAPQADNQQHAFSQVLGALLDPVSLGLPPAGVAPVDAVRDPEGHTGPPQLPNKGHSQATVCYPPNHHPGDPETTLRGGHDHPHGTDEEPGAQGTTSCSKSPSQVVTSQPYPPHWAFPLACLCQVWAGTQ